MATSSQYSSEAQRIAGVLRGKVQRNVKQRTAQVILFRESGKYYTEEWWVIPDGAIGPSDMEHSPDFRRIARGPVLVVTQEPWGFPHLL